MLDTSGLDTDPDQWRLCVWHHHLTRKLCRNAYWVAKNVLFGLDSPYIETGNPILIILNYIQWHWSQFAKSPCHSIATQSPIHLSLAHNLQSWGNIEMTPSPRVMHSSAVVVVIRILYCSLHEIHFWGALAFNHVCFTNAIDNEEKVMFVLWLTV